ncbi:hypothetical protein [Thiomicrorhabdus sp. 6S3-12]|uniref:hypothetical protein n=1 Tax=Thiomicrorhabdus sp. 6S3-12 TaxID=2819681 RepID=UPI001AAD3932|nr:hypothetical protein [Thiomicrorhabdus sp. 6S3-12]MBO1922992.1 hypothetical protein [Thiomicrorhabdus sp. 6S3-12]
MSAYCKYRLLKKKLNFNEYKGKPLGDLVGFFIADYVYNVKPSFNVWRKVKYLIRMFFLIPSLKADGKRSDVLYVYSVDRKDHVELGELYLKQLNLGADEAFLGSSKVIKKLRFSIVLVLKSYLLTAKLKLASQDRLFAVAWIYHQISFFLENEEFVKSYKKLLSYNSGYGYENSISWLFKILNRKVYSLQHGMYFEYKNSIPFDVINYENLACDVFFAWGRFTENQIENKKPVDVKVEIIGNPRYCETENIINKGSGNVVLVSMPRDLYSKEYNSLLKILMSERFNSYDFLIKSHPFTEVDSLREEYGKSNLFFLESKMAIKDLINHYVPRYCIGFNTTVLFECAWYGLDVGQFITGNDEFLDVGFHQFSSCNELASFLATEEFKPLEEKYYFDSCITYEV